MPEVRILIVENSDVRGRALDMILSDVGDYETILVSSVTDALIQIKEQHFDLVLTNTVVKQPEDGLKLA